MPYIKPEDRNDIRDALESVNPVNAGELQYVFAVVLNNYMRDREMRYQDLNDIIGALEGAKLEFYRRVVVPYEDTKIKENGDVY